MDKHVIPNRKRTLPALAVAIAVMSTLFVACEQASSAGTHAAATSALRSKPDAMAALMALPELQAWSAHIAQSSGGKLHGALVEYDATPRMVGGKAYFQFSFVENGSDAARNWESFLVADQGREILVDDAAADKVLTLAEWRKAKRPMEQIAAR